MPYPFCHKGRTKDTCSSSCFRFKQSLGNFVCNTLFFIRTFFIRKFWLKFANLLRTCLEPNQGSKKKNYFFTAFPAYLFLQHIRISVFGQLNNT